MTDFSIQPITLNDSRSVFKLLCSSFFTNEPITKDFKTPTFENFVALKALEQNHSLKAVDKQGNILGVAVNYEVDQPPFEFKSDDPDFMKLYTFFEQVEDEIPNLGAGLLIIHILTVDKNYTGLGIAKHLVEATEEHAKKAGLSGVKMECTSYYSAKVAKARKFELVYKVGYENIKNEEGEAIFNPPLPHTEFQVFVKRF